MRLRFHTVFPFPVVEQFGFARVEQRLRTVGVGETRVEQARHAAVGLAKRGVDGCGGQKRLLFALHGALVYVQAYQTVAPPCGVEVFGLQVPEIGTPDIKSSKVKLFCAIVVMTDNSSMAAIVQLNFSYRF